MMLKSISTYRSKITLMMANLQSKKSTALSHGFGFTTNTRGNVIINFALALPVVLGALGTAVDFGTHAMKQSTLQSASDSAALAGAKEMALSSSSDSSITVSALAFLAEQLKAQDSAAVGTVVIDRKLGTVKVTTVEAWQPFFAHVLSQDVTPVVASATASLVGASSICVLTLNTNSNRALHMDKVAKLTANGCGVYSNSKNNSGITVDQSAVMKASLVCSAGGVKQKGTISPSALTDCPAVDDPLVGRLGLNVAGCDYNNFKIAGGNQTLNPGRYCGGLEVTNTASVQLQPGDYIIKDGPLKVSDTAIFSGKHVGFYLSGNGATIEFTGNAEVSLTGSITPEMSGLLFFEDRAAPMGRQHKIESTLVKTLTGTIYLPRGFLMITPNAVVAGQSAYTAIISDRLELSEGPELVLNSDYSASDVPVPDGIRTSASVVLSQ